MALEHQWARTRTMGHPLIQPRDCFGGTPLSWRSYPVIIPLLHWHLEPSIHLHTPILATAAHKTSSGRNATAGAHNGRANTSTSFQLTISINNADTNQPVSFKQDGKRFDTSVRTLKLFADTKYKCQLKCRPAIEFHSLHLGGSDLELVSEHRHTAPGEYTAIWNTVGMVASKKGARNDILLVITGPSGALRRKIQTKFYALGDTHGDWGSKMGSLVWTCQTDPGGGDINISEEQIF